MNEMGTSLFRFMAVIGRTQIVANTLGTFTLLLVFVLGGFIVAKGKQHFVASFTDQRELMIENQVSLFIIS